MDGWMDGRALSCQDGCRGPRAPALPSLTVSWEHKKCTQAAGIGAFSLRISLGGKEGNPPSHLGLTCGRYVMQSWDGRLSGTLAPAEVALGPFHHGKTF